MKGVTRGLYSAPLEYSSPASYMHIHECHSICTCIMTRRAENIMVPHCLSNRKSAILIQNSHFTPILIHFHIFYFFFSFTNSVSMILRPWRWKVIKSIRLLQTWWVSLSDPFSCFVHKAWSPNSFNIQFPMNNKFITHVYDVALNTSMHQYCVILIAPPTGHRNSDKHHPIYMTFMGFLSIPYTTTWYATRRSAHPPTAPLPDACGLQINQNTTDHKFVWGIFHL